MVCVEIAIQSNVYPQIQSKRLELVKTSRWSTYFKKIHIIWICFFIEIITNRDALCRYLMQLHLHFWLGV